MADPNSVTQSTPPGVQPSQPGVANQYTSIQVKQLSDGSLPGVVLGQGPGDNVAFYGGTPAPQVLQGTLSGNHGLTKIYTSTQSPSAVAGNTTAEFSATVTGVAATDMVIAVNKPTSQAGIAVGTARVIGTNTVGLSFGNLTSGSLTPTASEGYEIVTVNAALQYPAVALTPAAVPADTTQEQTFTVPGVQVGMFVAVSKPTVQAGLLVTGARVVAVDTVAIEFMNVTSSAITPTAAESYLFFGAQGLRLQPVMARRAISLTPAAVAANTTAEQTFTVSNLPASTAIAVDMPYLVAGVSLVGARVSAANTLALNFGNDTANSLVPPAGAYVIASFPDPVPAAGSANTLLTSLGMDAPGVQAGMNQFGTGT